MTKEKLLYEEPKIGDIEQAKDFVRRWGSGQSSDADMLDQLLELMGYSKISEVDSIDELDVDFIELQQ